MPIKLQYLEVATKCSFNHCKLHFFLFLSVIIHYIGPGKCHTGDWCFKDGFITFLDLMTCYREWFTGKTMELVSDCS